MSDFGTRFRHASSLFLLAGLVFLVLSVIRLAQGGTQFAIFFAVGVGNFLLAFVMRKQASEEFHLQEREEKEELELRRIDKRQEEE
jgi:hypothetical protein